MGSEAKREGHPSEAAVTFPCFYSTDMPALRPAAEPGQPHVIWFDATDPQASPPPKQRKQLWAVPLLVAALVAAALLHSLILRALLPVAFAAAAIVLVIRARRPRQKVQEIGSRSRSQPTTKPAAPASPRGLCLAGDRLLFHTRGQAPAHPLLSTGEPFGVTLLASPRRDRIVTLLSSSAGAFYLGASFDPTARRAFAELLDRASIVSADEAGLSAIGPDGDPIALEPTTLAALVSELERRSPGCLDRLFLTDARAAALSLDGRELRAGDRTFDLGAPLEWRAFVFQESLGQAVALYQGTWVRQGSSEIVLVCLLPAITPAPEGEGVSLSSLDRGALRDLRLMQGGPEEPPPFDQRVAVDRLVMLPIRSALDKAPRPAAQPLRARA